MKKSKAEKKKIDWTGILEVHADVLVDVTRGSRQGKGTRRTPGDDVRAIANLSRRIDSGWGCRGRDWKTVTVLPSNEFKAKKRACGLFQFFFSFLPATRGCTAEFPACP